MRAANQPAVVHNASWAIGEIAIQLGGANGASAAAAAALGGVASPIGGASSGFERYAAPCVRALAPLIAEAEALSSLGLSRSLLENIASTLGRVCLVCPHETAPLFGEVGCLLDWTTETTTRDTDDASRQQI